MYKRNAKKKKNIRNTYIMICFILAFVSAVWMWYWDNLPYWNEKTQAVKQLVCVGLCYCVVYWFFVRMYQAQKIGVYRLTELTYFQVLSFGMSDGLMLVASMFWFRRFSIRLIFICFVVLICQIVTVTFWIFLFNRFFGRYDAPPRTIIVYGEDGYQSVLRKMKVLSYHYDVRGCYADTTPVDILKKIMNESDRIYLYRVNDRTRHELILYCNEVGKDIYLSQEIEDLITMGFDVSHSFDTPFIRTRRNQVKWYYPIVKRTFDIVCSGLAIIVLSPVYLITALAIKIYDGGPALYSQVRLTEGHREFKIYKFRSMIVDAEKHGARLAAQNDNRITPIGKIIRATRLDELPQLFNILKGDMSIVGPRPERPEIEEKYLKELPEFGLRLRVKAGLTGYAQVFGKYNTTPEDKLKLDLLYINQRSLLLDLKLILYTIKILFIPESTEGIAEGQTTAMKSKED